VKEKVFAEERAVLLDRYLSDISCNGCDGSHYK